jgi:DHA1 family solute carrier family 18 vesicular amine transporter 1/2
MTVVQDCGSVGASRFSDYLQRCRESRRLVLVIVAIALLLDNMLLTTVGESLVSCTLTN